MGYVIALAVIGLIVFAFVRKSKSQNIPTGPLVERDEPEPK